MSQRQMNIKDHQQKHYHYQYTFFYVLLFSRQVENYFWIIKLQKVTLEYKILTASPEGLSGLSMSSLNSCHQVAALTLHCYQSNCNQQARQKTQSHTLREVSVKKKKTVRFNKYKRRLCTLTPLCSEIILTRVKRAYKTFASIFGIKF